MLDRPQIVYAEAQQTAVIALSVARGELQRVMGPGLSELMATLAAQDIDPSGPWFNRYLRIAGGVFDFEISVPVPRPVTAAGRVRPGLLPATRVVRTVYHGSYQGLPGAWPEFDAWIAEQGLRAGSQLWECYSVGPDSSDDPADWRTELCRPLLE